MCMWKNYKNQLQQLSRDLDSEKTIQKELEKTHIELCKNNGRLMQRLREVSTENTELQKKYDELYEKYIDLLTKHETLLGIKKEVEK